MNRRPVERQDRGDDPVGLVDHLGLDRALVEDLAVQRVGQSRVVVIARVAVGQVEPQRVAAWLADLASLEFGQFVYVRADLGGRQPQQPAPLTRGRVAPGP